MQKWAHRHQIQFFGSPLSASAGQHGRFKRVLQEHRRMCTGLRWSTLSPNGQDRLAELHHLVWLHKLDRGADLGGQLSTEMVCPDPDFKGHVLHSALLSHPLLRLADAGVHGQEKHRLPARPNTEVLRTEQEQRSCLSDKLRVDLLLGILDTYLVRHNGDHLKILKQNVQIGKSESVQEFDPVLSSGRLVLVVCVHDHGDRIQPDRRKLRLRNLLCWILEQAQQVRLCSNTVDRRLFGVHLRNAKASHPNPIDDTSLLWIKREHDEKKKVQEDLQKIR